MHSEKKEKNRCKNCKANKKVFNVKMFFFFISNNALPVYQQKLSPIHFGCGFFICREFFIYFFCSCFLFCLAFLCAALFLNISSPFSFTCSSVSYYLRHFFLFAQLRFCCNHHKTLHGIKRQKKGKIKGKNKK